MSSTVILAAAAAFALGCVFCLGLWWLSTHRSRRGIMETMKAAVWLCLCNGCAWVWCSYLLAYLGREQIAEQLSGKAVTEIIAVILAYAIKSLVENLSTTPSMPPCAPSRRKHCASITSHLRKSPWILPGCKGA